MMEYLDEVRIVLIPDDYGPIDMLAMFESFDLGGAKEFRIYSGESMGNIMDILHDELYADTK